MHKLFVKHKKTLLILALPYLALMFLMTYRIDYRITTPGDLTPIDEFLSFEGAYPQENPFTSIYVMSVDRPTFFMFIASYFSPYNTISALPQSSIGVSDRANFESGQVARNSSIELSVINAYESLGFAVEYVTEEIVYLRYDYMDNRAIEIGDVVLAVNGEDAIYETLAGIDCGEQATLSLRKPDGTTVTEAVTRQSIDGSCLYGLSLTTYHRITEIEFPYYEQASIVGGPSGGLMQTLHAYNSLTAFDLTEGVHVTGTGTIRFDGTVGAIGGVREKVITAHLRGADIFFVPEGNNLAQAERALAELPNTSMQVVGVSRFEDALNYLLIYHGVKSDD